MRVPRPQSWDVLLALAGAAALVAYPVHRGTGSLWITIPLSLVACLPLTVSSRMPLAALVGVAAGLVVCLAVFQPYDTASVVLAVAVYKVTSLGDRRRSLIVGAGTAIFGLAGVLILRPRRVPAHPGVPPRGRS